MIVIKNLTINIVSDTQHECGSEMTRGRIRLSIIGYDNCSCSTLKIKNESFSSMGSGQNDRNRRQKVCQSQKKHH